MTHILSVCTLPAAHAPGVGLAASAGAQSAGGVHLLGRNARQWQEIAYFLSGFRPVQSSAVIQPVLAACAGSGQAQRRTPPALAAIIFGGCVAPCTPSVPDGNHGDNFARGTV